MPKKTTKDSKKEAAPKKEEAVKEKAEAVEEPVEKKEETVQVKLSTIEEMQAQIDRLTAAADINRLSKYDADKARDNELVKKVKISFWDSKPVVATRTIKDDVYVDSHGVRHETQVIEVTTKDDQKYEVDLIHYTRGVEKKIAEILSETKDNDGNLTLEVRLKESGEALKIDNKFVN